MWLLKVYLAGTFSLVVGACRRIHGTPERSLEEPVGALEVKGLKGKGLNVPIVGATRPRDVEVIGVVRWIYHTRTS